MKDMDAAVVHPKAHGVEAMGGPTTMTEGPSEGLTWVYFKAPWGMAPELVGNPRGMAVTRAGRTRCGRLSEVRATGGPGK